VGISPAFDKHSRVKPLASQDRGKIPTTYFGIYIGKCRAQLVFGFKLIKTMKPVMSIVFLVSSS